MDKFKEEFDEAWKKWQEEKSDELYPNIMLLGCSGAGKSSLINKIFGGYIAPVNHAEPGTHRFILYKGENYKKTVNLIDSAGYELGNMEAYHKGIRKILKEGIEGERIHIIWYCISVAGKSIQEIDKKTLKMLMGEATLRERICIVFTKCDEDTKDQKVVKQFKQTLLEELPFAPCCFATSSDEEVKHPFDLSQLIAWSAEKIDNEDLQNKFIEAQMVDLDAKTKPIQQLIAAACTAAAAAAVVPLPFASSAALVPIQVGLVTKIIDIYGVTHLAKVTPALIGGVIIQNIGRSLAANLIKLIPGAGAIAGGAINAAVASALTAAIGAAASEICYYNVKKYINGEEVLWDSIFETGEFANMVSTSMNTWKSKNKN